MFEQMWPGKQLLVKVETRTYLCFWDISPPAEGTGGQLKPDRQRTGEEALAQAGTGSAVLLETVFWRRRC